MSEILIGLFSISAIAALLALLLEVADRFFADYGEKHIVINDDKDLLIKAGRPLLFTLAEEKIYIPSACGGKGTCGLCKVKIAQGGGPVLPTETPYLNLEELADNIRLSCQVKVKADVQLEIDEELFNIQEFTVAVDKVEPLTPDIKYIGFKILSPEDGITFKAGQYMQLEAPPYKLSKESEFRAYSIATSPFEKNTIGFMITRVKEGVVSNYVHDYLDIGDTATLRGPFGEFCLRESDREMLMIATGSGLAPIYSMIQKIYREGAKRKITLFFGDRKPFDLIYHEELKEFEQSIGDFTYIPTLSRTTDKDNWSGEKGRVTDLIKKYIPDNPEIDVYICGAPAMVSSCEELLLQKGVPVERICYDKFM